MSYKVGDKVRIITTYATKLTGQIHSINRIESDHEYYFLVNGITDGPYSIDDFEYAKVANTKIARKLYPDYVEDGEWLVLK